MLTNEEQTFVVELYTSIIVYLQVRIFNKDLEVFELKVEAHGPRYSTDGGIVRNSSVKKFIRTAV